MMTSEPIPSPSSSVAEAYNVLLVIDAESVLSRYPQPSQDAAAPTSISDGLIFFTLGNISKEIVINDSKLTLSVEVGRNIHLRGRSISLIAEHSVVIYRLTVTQSGALSDPHLEVHPDLTVPAPNPENPTVPASRKADDHFWVCTAKAAGVTQCELSFMLVNQQCEAVGYFSWQTKVEIKP